MKILYKIVIDNISKLKKNKYTYYHNMNYHNMCFLIGSTIIWICIYCYKLIFIIVLIISIKDILLKISYVFHMKIKKIISQKPYKLHYIGFSYICDEWIVKDQHNFNII